MSTATAQQAPIPEWPCTRTRRQQPSLTLKDNDLFLITDTLGHDSFRIAIALIVIGNFQNI